MFRAIYFLLILVLIQPIEDSLLWDESIKLKWTDFRGLPNDDSDAAAITASGITVELSAKTTQTKLIEHNAIIEARFYPDKSWYRKELANSFILAHEQLHFDITELYARKLRQEIDNATFSIHIKKEISKLNKAIDKELRDLQKRYDHDSNFSLKMETQRKWQEYVDRELNKLSKYKSY